MTSMSLLLDGFWAYVPLSTVAELALAGLLLVTMGFLLVSRLLDKFTSGPARSADGDGPRVAGGGERGEPAGRQDVGPASTSGRIIRPDEPVEFLTDEDRVIRLLESNGGQVRQLDIVEQTEWSKSKVSRLLSRMHDNDQIEKISMGRENLIALPGHAAINDRMNE